MAEAWDQILELFRSENWKFEIDEDKHVLHSGMTTDIGDWQIFATVWDDDECFLMLSVLPMKCPRRKQAACAELLNRINFGKAIGCFEMDHESGMIHFKSTVPLDQGVIAQAVLEKVVKSNLSSMHTFLAAIMAVICGDTSPKDALAQVEVEAKGKPGAKAGGQPGNPALPQDRFRNN